MLRFIGKRLLMMIPVVLGVIIIVFTMMYITPGDPARAMLGETALEEDVLALREELGLDDPYFVRLGRYVKNLLLHGDLGISYTTKQPVMTEILARFPTTFWLSFLSVVIAVGVGIPLGVLSATKQYSVFDTVCTSLGLIGVSMPNFWQGLMLIILFSINLGWLPSSGFYGPAYWILPAVTIGTSSAGMIMRMTRSSMLETIRQDYIRTAYAKGQTPRNVIIKHALSNALIPVTTTVGLQFGIMLGGSVLTESIFSVPGIGKLMIEAIKGRNYPVVQGGVLFIAVVFSFVNLIVDLLYAYIDPRIKAQYSRKKTPKKG